MDYINPKLILNTSDVNSGTVRWQSPSNIALIKYWGKHDNQIPRNASLSFTLSKSYTDTKLSYKPKLGTDKGLELEYYFEGKKEDAFGKRVSAFLESLYPIFPFLKQLELEIHSSNTFPHSAGIASSASAFSALALCLCSLEDRLFSTLKEDEDFRRKASYIARLGSGSASRSIFAKVGLWGQHSGVEGSSDEYAIDCSQFLHKNFDVFHDYILIIDAGTKEISSTRGHELMNEHPFAQARYQQAHKNLSVLRGALERGDLDMLGRISESEALTLHGLMMSSPTPYILFQPNTIKVLQLINEFKKTTGHPVFFTLDAGANVHMLFPDSVKKDMDSFTENVLLPWCQDGQVIKDMIGDGPLEVD